MKKIILATAAIASIGSMVSGTAAAAAVSLTPGGVTSVTSGSSGTCPLLAENITVKISTSNIGAFECNTTSANIGVAVASTVGKNKVYSLGSAGGKITETTTSTTPVQNDVNTAAVSAGS